MRSGGVMARKRTHAKSTDEGEMFCSKRRPLRKRHKETNRLRQCSQTIGEGRCSCAKCLAEAKRAITAKQDFLSSHLLVAEAIGEQLTRWANSCSRAVSLFWGSPSGSAYEKRTRWWVTKTLRVGDRLLQIRLMANGYWRTFLYYLLRAANKMI